MLLIGDYNVVASDGKGDIYSPASWKNDALLQPETRAAYRRMLDQGWTDSIAALHPGQPIYTFWDFMRQRWPRNAGLPWLRLPSMPFSVSSSLSSCYRMPVTPTRTSSW